MSTKSELLKLLEDAHGAYISGAALASEMSISRNAVWKAIVSLREEGYGISAVTNKGYRLEYQGDILSEAGIIVHIKNKGVFQVDIRKSVTSTNTLLRELAVIGAPEGYVVAAEEQTAGKGRMGRLFHSPAGHGAYFSLLLRPESSAADTALITSAAAVATAMAIEDVIGVNVGIKWVNDLFIGWKKVCGILTEAAYSMESGLIESVVLGIGINVTIPEGGFPDELRNTAAALTDKQLCSDDGRCRLIAATLDNLWGFYQELPARKFLADYMKRSILLGRDIFVISNDSKRPARALAIDNDCRLVVRYENGETASLNSGEVSIRIAES